MFEVKNMNTDEGIDLENFDKEAEIAKYEAFESKLWNIVIRLYSPAAKTKSGILITDTIRDNAQYQTCVGLVVKIAPGCYKDKRYIDTGPACEVGDWVVIARHSGLRVKYKGLPTFITKEDAIEGKIGSPTDIERN